ncbi:hypothetical protein Ciccas_001276 [Cichlidogyrus casuarinus]|uniref:Uncharacterized protein n=1 Tax=Cichlidogyrus casuarinus TaxID=1844966 RepID=A0ABD2QKQ6_9PLAT
MKIVCLIQALLEPRIPLNDSLAMEADKAYVIVTRLITSLMWMFGLLEDTSESLENFSERKFQLIVNVLRLYKSLKSRMWYDNPTALAQQLTLFSAQPVQAADLLASSRLFTRSQFLKAGPGSLAKVR